MTDTETLAAGLRRIVGDDAVSLDPARRTLVSQDIWAVSDVISDLVVAPADTDSLAAAVAAIARAGRGIAIRGGGMSYTSGYVPTRAGSVTLDLGRMNRVLDINATNMTVTVQAGCTWTQLHEQLRAQGLRTPYWGTLSGSHATVGGGMSQNSILFGAGRYGVSSDSLIALRVVLADGRILNTGAQGRSGKQPFFRHYGPDLTGLFCGDCGALGIKAELTLRLIHAPAEERYLSVAFGSHVQAMAVMAEITRRELASEVFGTDPELLRMQLKRASLAAGLQTMADLVSNSGSLLKGIGKATRVALAGRNFADDNTYVVHVVCEGRQAVAVNADLDAARTIALAAGGKEVESTVPTVMRSRPFPPLNNVLGPGGERWLPIHGIFALGDAQSAYEAMQRLFTDNADFARHGISTGFLFATISTSAMAIEPVLYWPEAFTAIHAATIEPAVLAKLPQHAANPAATEAVQRVRRQLLDIFQECGAAHLQIGRTYRYRQSRDAATLELLDTLKRVLDSTDSFNDGVLGFATGNHGSQQ